MAIAGCYLLLLSHIVRYLLPLFARKDGLLDIPLTPSQRALLGLDPNTAVSTDGPYSTPPRYALNSSPGSRNSIGNTPRSVSTGGIASPSPLSGKGANGMSTLQRRLSNSPFSPPTVANRASPHGPFGPATPRSAGKDLFAKRRYSYGSPNLHESGSGKENGVATPSPPPGGKGANLLLGNRWLYEKGRESITGW
jgi:nucleoporin POM34